MSPASSSRWAGSTRARCSSTSGRRPAFQASMNSLRTRSGSRGTEDPLQFLQAAAAALVDVVDADAETLGDLLAVELLEVGELEDLAVLGVSHLRDPPSDEPRGVLARDLVVERLVGLRAPLGVVGGERGVVRATLAAGLPGLVEAAGAAALVAQLLAPVVQTRVVHDAVHRGLVLAELVLAEAPPHGDHAQVGLARRAADLVRRQAASAAGEAERLAERLDAVEALDGEVLPGAGGLVVAALLTGAGVAAQEQMIGFVGHPWGRVAHRGGDLTAAGHCDRRHGTAPGPGYRDRRGRTRSGPSSGGQTGTRSGPHGAGTTDSTHGAAAGPRAHGPPSERDTEPATAAPGRAGRHRGAHHEDHHQAPREDPARLRPERLAHALAHAVAATAKHVRLRLPADRPLGRSPFTGARPGNAPALGPAASPGGRECRRRPGL